ncbi:hemerythrin domain-containing protein [Fulvimarina endophytica]|nr:hemerythrin domain-containing protein [Fulvimarina endophytica]
MAKTTLLDDRTRPKGPTYEGLDAVQARHGEVLAHIHASHLRELTKVTRTMAEVEAGERDLPALSAAVETLPMAEAYRSFGTLCGRECALLTFHHDAEEQHVFPALRRRAPEGLIAVLDRLAAEHVIIHEHIDALAEAARSVVNEPGPQAFARCRDALTALERLVRSHFRYEEGELAGPIGFYGVPV